MNAADIEEFEAVKSQLAAAREELLVLVKKTPNDALSAFKLGLVNGLLRRANAIVDDDERPMADFSEFSNEALPSTSDAVLVIAQYLIALENFRAKRIGEDSIGQWHWLSDGGKHLAETYPPRRHTR
jgi:hypothetical protein